MPDPDEPFLKSVRLKGGNGFDPARSRRGGPRNRGGPPAATAAAGVGAAGAAIFRLQAETDARGRRQER